MHAKAIMDGYVVQLERLTKGKASTIVRLAINQVW